MTNCGWKLRSVIRIQDSANHLNGYPFECKDMCMFFSSIVNPLVLHNENFGVCYLLKKIGCMSMGSLLRHVETGLWGPGSNPAPCIGSTASPSQEAPGFAVCEWGEQPSYRKEYDLKQKNLSCLLVSMWSQSSTWNLPATQNASVSGMYGMSRRKRAKNHTCLI